MYIQFQHSGHIPLSVLNGRIRGDPAAAFIGIHGREGTFAGGKNLLHGRIQSILGAHHRTRFRSGYQRDLDLIFLSEDEYRDFDIVLPFYLQQITPDLFVVIVVGALYALYHVGIHSEDRRPGHLLQAAAEVFAQRVLVLVII